MANDAVILPMHCEIASEVYAGGVDIANGIGTDKIIVALCPDTKDGMNTGRIRMSEQQSHNGELLFFADFTTESEPGNYTVRGISSY